MKLWNVMFNIFFFSTLFVTVWFITQINWGNISTFKVIEYVGVIGGLTYLGTSFRNEIKVEEKA